MSYAWLVSLLHDTVHGESLSVHFFASDRFCFHHLCMYVEFSQHRSLLKSMKLFLQVISVWLLVSRVLGMLNDPCFTASKHRHLVRCLPLFPWFLSGAQRSTIFHAVHFMLYVLVLIRVLTCVCWPLQFAQLLEICTSVSLAFATLAFRRSLSWKS